jgi:hypothetical protein
MPPGGSVVDGVTDVVVLVDEVVLVEDNVDDVEVVVVGARVVDDVDEVVEEVEAPTSVTLMTFDGPLSNGAPGSAAWLSATMATVSVSVRPGAGSTTENVCAQGVAAQTTDPGWLPTWVQFSDAETKLSWVQTVASP